jgi:hypothetical protein
MAPALSHTITGSCSGLPAEAMGQVATDPPVVAQAERLLVDAQVPVARAHARVLAVAFGHDAAFGYGVPRLCAG